MKTRKWPAITLTLLSLSLVSCSDWGESDPPAGNQVYPKLEQIAEYTFEDNPSIPEDFLLCAFDNGDVPSVIKDAEEGSAVLNLNGGYARISNPLNKTKVQNAVSMTFYIKQAAPVVDEVTGEVKEAHDLSGALFSFANENNTQKMYFTANGMISFDGMEGEFEVNNPNEAKTALLNDAGKWHYVALSITNERYIVYVDGERRMEQNVTSFDMSKIVMFMNNAPYLYLGYGSDTQCREWWIDNIKIYRNKLTSKETADPRKPKVQETEVYEDLTPTVGNPDCTDGFWSSFSNNFFLYGKEKTLHLSFTNKTAGGNNWENWVLCIANGKKRGETGYAEHAVLRADAYGWGDSNYSGGTIASNYNWDTFKTDMNNANVEIDLTRSGNKISMKAVTTTTGGKSYTYTFEYNGELEETLDIFLTGEKSYLTMNKDNIYYEDRYTSGSYRVGPADCSAGWWSEFSNYHTVKGNRALGFTFVNTNNGSGNNWNNWLAVATTEAERGGTGYSEYFVLRSDAYGWGNSSYSGANISAAYDWATFPADMQKSTVDLVFARSGKRVDMTANVKKEDGTALAPYTFHYDNIEEENFNIFLLVEGASLDISSVRDYLYRK